LSAFFSFTHGDTAYLLADGGYFRPDGTLVHVDRKVWALPNHAIVITGRGTSALQVGEIVGHLLHLSENEGAKGTVDEMLEGISLLFDLLSDGGPFKADFVIAAHSETKGAVHFHVQCHDTAARAFELIPGAPDEQISSPAVVAADLTKLRGLTLGDIAAAPEANGIELMQIMRGKLARVPGEEKELHRVGGRIDLAVVGKGGVTIKQIATWPDECGKPIDPTIRAVPC
jgi:hypothetical protein